jgi:hypothetical protein
VKFNSLANSHCGDVGVALAVQGVVYAFTGWVKEDLFRHNLNDDFWHICSPI